LLNGSHGGAEAPQAHVFLDREDVTTERLGSRHGVLTWFGTGVLRALKRQGDERGLILSIKYPDGNCNALLTD